MSLIYKGVDYLNKKIGPFTITGPAFRKQYKSQTVEHWGVKCNCGNELTLSKQKILMRNMVGCIKCYGKKARFQSSKLWDNNIKYVPGMYYSKTKKSAEARNIEFAITREYMDELLINQNFKCVYTGLDIEFFDTAGRGSASIDRINPKLGYIEGNIHWVYKDVNTMKMDLTSEEFVRICKLIAENFKEKDK